MSEGKTEWRKISGEDNWEGLLEEPHEGLRRWLVQCGEMAQAGYDSFVRDKGSRFAGACRYTKKDFFPRVGLVKGKPYAYTISRFLYATSKVVGEVRRIIEKIEGEEVSISITGHSMGAALATLCALDISVNGYNQLVSSGIGGGGGDGGGDDADTGGGSGRPIPVTAYLFSSPKVGDSEFKELFSSQKHLRLLRVRNAMDVVPDYPLVGYSEVGVELKIDTGKSEYLKKVITPSQRHSLEVYLHGLAGVDGRDVSLMNKWTDVLKEEFMVPGSWWCEPNKGMVQQDDGSWRLDDHEIEIELEE